MKPSWSIPGGLARLVWFNLLRKPGRSVAMLLGVALTAGILHAGALIGMGVRQAAATGSARLGADLLVVPDGALKATHTALVMGEPVAFYMNGSVREELAAIPGVAAVSPQVYVETLASSACCTGRLFLVGFDPASDFTVQPWLLDQLGRPLAPDEIVIGNHVLVLTGEPMRFFGTDFRVAARLDATGMGMDETVFLPIDAVGRMAAASLTQAEHPLTIPPGHVSAVLVKLADPARAEAVAQQIAAEIPGVQVLTGGEITRSVVQSLNSLLAVLLPMGAGLGGVAAAMLALLFAAIAAERSREIGLLRAMGASARQTGGVLLGEALLLGSGGGLLGVAVGFAVFSLFQRAIRLSYTLPFLWPSLAVQALIGVAVCLLAVGLSALAAFPPVRRVTGLEPHLAIHGGKA